MLVIAIILSVLLLIALLRVGVIIEYNDAGPALWLKIGFIKIKIDEYETKRKNRRISLKKVVGDMKPGSLNDFLDIFKIIKDMLGRLRRRLLIKRLVIHFTSAGDDPAQTALMFGAANAVFGVIVPVLERHFRIKRRDLRTAADFDSKEPGIYVLLNISIAVWESIYVLLALMPIMKLTDKRKAEEENGKGTDKQLTGHDDAEDQGDDRS